MKNSIVELTENEINHININGGSPTTLITIGALIIGFSAGYLYPEISGATSLDSNNFKKIIGIAKDFSFIAVTFIGTIVLLRKIEKSCFHF